MSSTAPRPAPHRRPLALRPRASMTTPPRRAGTSPRATTTTLSPAHRLWKGALLFGVAAASAFGVVKIRSVIEGTAHLPVRTISVVGVDPASPRAAEVKAYAEVEAGAPFFGIDTDAIAARVERHPFIREAAVRRVPPDALEIVVEERTPRAALRHADALYLVDEDGDVMKRARPGDPLDLPVVTLQSTRDDGSTTTEPSPRLRDALAVLRAADAAGVSPRVSEVIELPAVGFEIVLDDGARARVGNDGFDDKLRRLVATEQLLATHGRRFTFMWLDDARHPERVAVRLRTTTETTPSGG